MPLKKILILDVDETLLNIEPLFYLKLFKKEYASYGGKTINIFSKEYYISLRPNTETFLKLLNEKFRLIAFSTVEKEITLKKLVLFGLENYFIKIYGKEELVNKKKSLKPICSNFNASIEEIQIIDDNPCLYEQEFQSHITKIKPWYMGREDNCLIPLAMQLNKI